MIEGITEQELRQDVAEARLRPEADARDARIYRAIRRIISEGSVFYVLADTPDQHEDAFNVLVDDKVVVGFELARSEPDALPTDVDQYSVKEYAASIDGDFAEVKFRIALELARRDLGR